jgi:hypothetical protein
MSACYRGSVCCAPGLATVPFFKMGSDGLVIGLTTGAGCGGRMSVAGDGSSTCGPETSGAEAGWVEACRVRAVARASCASRCSFILFSVLG